MQLLSIGNCFGGSGWKIASRRSDYLYPEEFLTTPSCGTAWRWGETNSRFPLCHWIKRHGRRKWIVSFPIRPWIIRRINLFLPLANATVPMRGRTKMIIIIASNMYRVTHVSKVQRDESTYFAQCSYKIFIPIIF